MPSGRQGEVDTGLTLLEASRRLGVELESICGSKQTCGRCLVTPEYGNFAGHGINSKPEHITAPGADERDYARKNNLNLEQQRLSCAAGIQGDLLLHIPETSLARKQVIRKTAGSLSVTVAPAVQLFYVEVPPAVPGGRGDWQCLRDALREQCGLTDLQPDPHLLPIIQHSLRQANGRVTVTVWQRREVIRIEPGYVERLYGTAIDVGSTTLVCHLCDLRTGEIVATESMMNPQGRYGEDIISRISSVAAPAGMRRLHHAIIRALNDLCQNAAHSASMDAAEITDMVLVGNSVMHHILLNINPAELGHLPFALATDEALDLRAREIGLSSVHPGAHAHILPCIAGYVGADNVAVLLAEYPYLQDEITLIVDIGTNAELLLCTRERILSASSPTGPAFEGAQITHGQRAAVGAIERVRIEADRVRYKIIGDDRWNDQLNSGESLSPTGICGSGIIEVVAELFSAGIIGANGRFSPNISNSRVRFHGHMGEYILAYANEGASGQDIVVTQTDIRAIQLAKGALYAGARLLMDRLGVSHVDHIRLAGAFGSYIDPQFAMCIGLIPDCDLSRVVAVGNAAGDGARIALLNTDERTFIQQLVRKVEYVETAAEPRFQDYFVDALTLPHAVDSFLSLETKT